MLKTLLNPVFNQNKLSQLLADNSQRMLALMLLSLHAFLIWGDGTSALQHAFFLCHYGLFLLWQPVWRSTEKLSKPAVIIFIAIGLVGFLHLSWWLIALWLAVLFGLLGGRVFADESKATRLVHILAASYLLSMLLLWVVPKLLGASNDLEAAKFVITYLTPILPLAILFINKEATNSGQLPVLDFFYTLLLMLVALILVLASYAIGTLQSVNYIQVMFIAIFGLAFVLAAFSLLWQPSTRFSGIELLMSRYLLSIGMPFEKWVKKYCHTG